MQEYQVIQKIKKLQQIKPNKNWVVFSKNEILGPELEEKTPLSAWFILPFRKPALVFSSILLIAVALTGIFFYLNSQNPQIVQNPQTDSDNAEVLASLQGLEGRLKEINSSLDNLKNIKDQNQALVMTEIVKSTAKEGERMVNDLKKSKEPLSDKTLACLNGIGDSYKELGETAGDAQIEIIGGIIEYLKQRTLSEENQVRLQKMEEYYNEGEYSQVMMLIPAIENNN